MRRPQLRNAEKIAAAFLAAKTAREVFDTTKASYRTLRGRMSFAVTVTQADPLYADVNVALMGMIPARRLRSLTVRYQSDKKQASTAVFYDGKTTHKVTIGGHQVDVTTTNGAAPKRGGDSDIEPADDSRSAMREAKTVKFECDTAAARDAVIAWLGALADERRNGSRQPTMAIVSQWGGWERLPEFVPRDPSTVILPDGKIESVLDDVARFLADRDKYERIGIPWHRGYLFHGPPGTGKSTIARAITTRFNLDLHVVPLGDLEKDTNLLSLVANIRGGILLLEDIDVFHAATDREEAVMSSASLSGLLNALDGIATPPGLITVMTTNDIDALDPALIRPGRADMKMFVDYLDDDQVDRLYRLVYNRAVPVELPSVVGKRVCAAEILEACKPHMDDHAGGAAAVRELLVAAGPPVDALTIHVC